MSRPTLDTPIKPPTVDIINPLQAVIPWGGKAGDISFNRIKIPPGLTLHKINIHYKKESTYYFDSFLINKHLI